MLSIQDDDDSGHNIPSWITTVGEEEEEEVSERAQS
jgi:hypothetical protein